jgi:hypothetical protein
MAFQSYLITVSLDAGMMLLCGAPIILIALWRSRTRRWGPILSVAALPRVAMLQNLHWSWQATILTTALVLLVVTLTPGLSFASVGITSRLKPGSPAWSRGWGRERTDTVWLSVFGHNLRNVVIPTATLVSRFIP